MYSYEFWLYLVVVHSWQFQVTDTGAWNGESFQLTRSCQIVELWLILWSDLTADPSRSLNLNNGNVQCGRCAVIWIHPKIASLLLGPWQVWAHNAAQGSNSLPPSKGCAPPCHGYISRCSWQRSSTPNKIYNLWCVSRGWQVLGMKMPHLTAIFQCWNR